MVPCSCRRFLDSESSRVITKNSRLFVDCTRGDELDEPIVKVNVHARRSSHNFYFIFNIKMWSSHVQTTTRLLIIPTDAHI